MRGLFIAKVYTHKHKTRRKAGFVSLWRLTLGPGWSLAGLQKARLLALHMAWVALEVASGLEVLAEVCIALLKCAGDTHADSLCLGAHASSLYLRDYFEVTLDAVDVESVLGDEYAFAGLEVFFTGLAVHDEAHLPCWGELYASGSGLAAADGRGVSEFRHTINRLW